jgi:uncharacterized protein YhfF
MDDDVVAQRVEGFWRTFVDATGIDGEHTAWGFGSDDDPAERTQLGLLVRDGPKRATTSRVDDYDVEGEVMPTPGELSVIVDGEGEPICVIRTTEVEIRPFGEVDEAFAWVEGEGDRSLAYWRDVHLEFFEREGNPVDDATPVVLETFELLWPTPDR